MSIDAFSSSHLLDREARAYVERLRHTLAYTDQSFSALLCRACLSINASVWNFVDELKMAGATTTTTTAAARRSRSESTDATNKRQRTDNSAAATADATPVNAYTGFVVPHDNFQLERVHIRDVTPESFFERYVATRTPVVLEGFIDDDAFTAPAKWTNEYLRAQAGDETLAVERRGATHEKFGRGIEVPMQFKELLDLITSGDEMHYLTTQDVEADAEDGRPELMAPFVAKLQQDFPLQPALLGNLVPQNINIWMGNNKDGSSSGLHHDYHDNLYILLRGKKRFRLYSPADTHCMYTRGKLVRVHANGRINYEGEETTAYGADPLSEAAALASMEKDEAERELALAEQASATAKASGDAAAQASAQARLEAAEDRLDRAMCALLRVERDEDADGSEPEDGEFGAFHFDEGDDDDDEEEEDEEEDEDANGEDCDEDNENDSDEAVESAKELKSSTDGKRIVDKTVKDPVNFSRIDTFLLRDPASAETLHREFPLFKSANAAFCELSVGEMLFLPASWFHEVESFGGGAANGGHLALNYWYHPPDAFESFATPYSSPFWPRDWAQRMAQSNERASS